MPTTDTFSATKHDLAADVLRLHGLCRLEVSGCSMLPTLWPGEMVLIEKHSIYQLSIGDIIMYERGGRFILHRLTGLPASVSEIFSPQPFLIARGDFMPHDDLPVPADCVLGVLAGVRRGNDWAPIPQQISLGSRRLAALLRRSNWVVRVLLRVRGWWNYAHPAETLSEAPTA